MKKTAKQAMEPAAYREFLNQVELEAILLDTCTLKTNRDKLGSNMKLDIKHDATYTIDEDNVASIISSYDLTATKTTKRDFALKAVCAYRVILSSERPLSDDFLEIFIRVNIQMNTWPYFREFIQSMIQRAGFPPLTLPLFKR
ncbi:hypothetical protein DESC_700091 [Desulfosarcina cetonica]|uniref:protein-export chaperone SecB n=1 Tax=Desulfosarcina cetonica TaxID=90730 RepID=UPI0012EE5EEB|nr:protein-export chaperone SecB [Desulfosarcina cetonica]VTR68335.1 hypothetical protein DESC_700091 [Desulfosarcina cetonica]